MNNYSPITAKDIDLARKTLSGIVHHTPLLPSATFSRLVGSKVYLKMENLQKTGSFKIRGAYVKIRSLPEESRKRVVAASAGNHAQGVAYASSLMKIPCTIVMPLQASPSKVSATRSYGAKVVFHGSVYDEAFAKAEEIASATGATLIPAFDDPEVIAGQGTVGAEVIEDLPTPDSVYIPVGGGGLLAGMAVAIKSRNPRVRIIGVQSKAFPAMAASMKKGRLVAVSRGATLADGIAVKRPGTLPFDAARRLVDDIVLVDDRDIVKTMFLLMERVKVVVEPAGAAALAYLLATRSLKKDGTAVAVLSGGNIDAYVLGQIVSKGLAESGRMIRLSFNVIDRPGALKIITDRLAEARANIVEVEHDRLGAGVQAGYAKVTLSLETEDHSHTKRVLRILRKSGLKFTIT